jgi:uncharacterized membrane protein
VTLMLIVSISAFFIHQIRMWGPWSPIHLLAVYTLIMLPVGVIAAHRHVIERHRRTMVGVLDGGFRYPYLQRPAIGCNELLAAAQ